MHGHSTKKDVFMYACKSIGSVEDTRNNLFIRLFPFLLSRRNENFSYKSSHFRMEKFKESTSRIVFFRELGILNSFTIESSFLGPGDKNATHFLKNDLEHIGIDLCKQLLIYLNQSIFRKRLQELCTCLYSQPSGLINERSPFSNESRDLQLKTDLNKEENAIFDAELNERTYKDRLDLKTLLYEVDDLFKAPIDFESLSDKDSESDSDSSQNDDKRMAFVMTLKFKSKILHTKSHGFDKNDHSKSVLSTKSRPPSANLAALDKKTGNLNKSLELNNTKTLRQRKTRQSSSFLRTHFRSNDL